MKTKIIKVDSEKPCDDAIREAAEIVRLGSLVAFPTETVYGLGANAFDVQAIKKIFLAKRKTI